MEEQVLAKAARAWIEARAGADHGGPAGVGTGDRAPKPGTVLAVPQVRLAAR
jgi:hypothetical protein